MPTALRLVLKTALFSVFMTAAYEYQYSAIEHSANTQMADIFSLVDKSHKLEPPVFLPSPKFDTFKYLEAKLQQHTNFSIVNDPLIAWKSQNTQPQWPWQQKELASRNVSLGVLQSRRKQQKVLKGRTYERAFGMNPAGMILKEQMQKQLSQLGLTVQPKLV